MWDNRKPNVKYMKRFDCSIFTKCEKIKKDI